MRLFVGSYVIIHIRKIGITQVGLLVPLIHQTHSFTKFGAARLVDAARVYPSPSIAMSLRLLASEDNLFVASFGGASPSLQILQAHLTFVPGM